MPIKNDPNNPNTFLVSYAKRHPITRQSIVLRRKGIVSKAEAKRVHEDLIVKVNEKIKKAVTPTWKALCERYLEQCRNSGYVETTIHSYSTCLQAHTYPIWENRFIDSITTQEIRDVVQVKLSKRAPAHQKYFLQIIRSVFNFAIDVGIIQRNPTPILKFKVGDKIRSVLNENQIKTLLQKAQELEWEWYPHYAVALFTGMRSGELYALTWDKVDLEKRTILVNQSWNNKSGFKSTKSGDDRIIEIAKPLLSLLRELKVQSIDNSFVLPRNDRWDRGQQARDLRLFLKTLGLPEIRFHDLRASWATLLLAKGVEPSKVMTMGGWKDMETMMIYMRKAGINIKGSTACLDELYIHGRTDATLLNFG